MNRTLPLVSALTVLLLSLLSVTGCTGSPDSVAPLEQALSSGRPTLAEFGRGTCIPCRAMKPILEELAAEFKGKLNVVIVEVDTYRDLTYQYGIMAIPTQICFDSSGGEIARHIGFWDKADMIAQLGSMGID